MVRNYPKAPPSDRSALIDAILKGKTVKRPDGENPTAAGNLKKLRADYDAIRKNAQAARDPGTVDYNISDLLEEIEVNGNSYVKQLKATITRRKNVVTDDKARDKVRKAITAADAWFFSSSRKRKKPIAGSTIATMNFLVVVHEEHPDYTINQLRALLTDRTKFLPQPEAVAVLDAYIKIGEGDTVPRWH